MSIYYMDASTVVKRYVNEVGSDWFELRPLPLHLHCCSLPA